MLRRTRNLRGIRDRTVVHVLEEQREQPLLIVVESAVEFDDVHVMEQGQKSKLGPKLLLVVRSFHSFHFERNGEFGELVLCQVDDCLSALSELL